MTSERTGFRSYPHYKPSGIEWLGDVPAHWEVRRLRSLANITTGGQDTINQQDDGKYPFFVRSQTVERIDTWSFDGEAVLTAGDGVGVGKVFHYVNGKFDYHQRVYKFSDFSAVLGKFFFHYFRALLRFEVLQGTAKSTVDSLRLPMLQNFPVALPPLSEQTTIVRYLDQADERIHRYVSSRERLIELLEEYRQAVIHHAVTRGLDPDVRLKPSGVEWLGDVPAHWEVRRLKTLCSMKSGDGITAMSIEPTGEYPVYGGNGLRGYTSNYTHDGNYVLIGRQGALCGNVHIARGQFWASEHAVVASLSADYVLEWFAAILDVMDLNQYSIAAAQPGLAVERVLNLNLPVPPPQAQAHIARYIERETADIDAAIDRARREIELLGEYRTRLIADVVTGKVDVREAAAELSAV